MRRKDLYWGAGLGAAALLGFWLWGRRTREIPVVDPVSVKWVE